MDASKFMTDYTADKKWFAGGGFHPHQRCDIAFASILETAVYFPSRRQLIEAGDLFLRDFTIQYLLCPFEADGE
ncbi:MAG: hypothetical protein DHS20C08_11230 [Rhodomicrobium sp.]|nr:MAG: hypothetical protein DHS20C08_11230 [Rhodomicrobium sp.]